MSQNTFTAPKSKCFDRKLPTLNDLFTTQAERDARNGLGGNIRAVPLSMIDPFPNHPYEVRTDEDMTELIDSIKWRRQITPALLRPKQDGRYELICGHRRAKACAMAGLSTLLAEIKDLDRDDATMLMVDSNLQRTHILPSEKAKAYKMKMDAMKRKGYRTDLNWFPLGTRLHSDQALAKSSGDSRNQIWRFIRLNYLITPLLQLVDDEKLAMRPAVEISYLAEEQQQQLYEIITAQGRTPTLAQTLKMREIAKTGELDVTTLQSIMEDKRLIRQERIYLSYKDIGHLLPPGMTARQTEDWICAAVKCYTRHLERQAQRSVR